MKTSTTLSVLALLASVSARPTALNSHMKREVPQEHAHEKYLISVKASLNLNNPAGIADPVFGLLGNAAAAAGAGTIKNLDCLHQATADQAFTNAKAASDLKSQADALVFAALERNTAGVGVKSVLCTDKAVNPEIAAIKRIQDPASAGAKEGNRAIILELAKQLASIGSDPLQALDAGTFQPGDVNDATGAGNTCDDLGDNEGCIFTKNLLVKDVTPEEIAAAVGGAAGGATPPAAGNNATAPAVTSAAPAATQTAGGACPAVTTVTVDAPAATAAPTDAAACAAPSTVTVDAPAATQTAAPAVGGDNNNNAGGANIQTFTGALGGAPPAVVQGAGNRPFTVNGNTFVNAKAALERSCAIQNNACSNAVNSKTLALPGGVGDCGKQETECKAAAAN